jgi:hypothetical protein
MSELGDILGDEFEEEYEKQSAQGAGQTEKVSDKEMMEICYKAINDGGFEKDEPRFSYPTSEGESDVLLVNSPESDLQKFRFELGETAITQGMFHLGDLFQCTFQENMLDMLDKVELDTYYIVVGQYEEVTQTDDSGNTDTYYNINPTRGIVPLKAGKSLADKYEQQMGGTSIEEQSQAQSSSSDSTESDQTEESTSTDSDDTPDIGIGDSDNGEVSKESILPIFSAVGEQQSSILEGVSNGDSDAINNLVGITQDNVDENPDKERVLDVFEEEVEEIDGRGEDEEDDGGIDLGGIGGDDSSSEDDTEVVSASPTTDGGGRGGNEDTSDDDDTGSPEDWF